MRQSSFIPEFVELVPEILEEGHLYVSKRFRTASHLCACGCQNRVVTPLKPAKWTMTVEDGRVSLAPSIGRWQLPCKSHYWIEDNAVLWSKSLTEEEMAAVQRRDARDLAQYYESRRASRRFVSALRRLFQRWFRRGR